MQITRTIALKLLKRQDWGQRQQALPARRTSALSTRNPRNAANSRSPR